MCLALLVDREEGEGVSSSSYPLHLFIWTTLQALNISCKPFKYLLSNEKAPLSLSLSLSLSLNDWEMRSVCRLLPFLFFSPWFGCSHIPDLNPLVPLEAASFEVVRMSKEDTLKVQVSLFCIFSTQAAHIHHVHVPSCVCCGINSLISSHRACLVSYGR